MPATATTSRRIEFRKAIKNKLKTNFADKYEIYNGVRDPHSVKKLPAIFILNQLEDNTRLGDAPVVLKKKYSVGIEVMSSAGKVDDDLDTICSSIENSLLKDDGRFLGDDVYLFHLDSIDFSSASRGDEIIGCAKLTFDIIYRTKPIGLIAADLGAER